ncbi:hypothetical protein ABPG77_007844 [Micractinium sp. CCAP 211/92]
MSMPATPPSPLSHYMSACGALPVHMEAEAAVGEGARLYCPNPQCSQLLVADEKHADTPIDCPHCKHKLCANCGITWHAGMTCQQYQAQPGALRSKDDQALLDYAEQAGMRRCPACGVMVERTEGCSYMSCRCGARFCYSCGRRKEPHSNHYCDCKPAAEQWLSPPPGMARALEEYDARAAQQRGQAHHAARQRGRAQDAAAAAAAAAAQQQRLLQAEAAQQAAAQERAQHLAARRAALYAQQQQQARQQQAQQQEQERRQQARQEERQQRAQQKQQQQERQQRAQQRQQQRVQQELHFPRRRKQQEQHLVQQQQHHSS